MHSLAFKLTLAFLAVSLLGVGLFAGFVWFSTARQFDQFLVDRAQSDFAASAQEYYRLNGSWVGVGSALQTNSKPDSHGEEGKDILTIALADASNRIIVGGGKYSLGEDASDKEIQQGLAILVNGERVGTALKTGDRPTRNPAEETYLATTNRALFFAALSAAVLSLGLGVLLARTITSPVRDLTQAVHALAKGNIKTVAVRSKDEIGELTTTFNQMSTDLQRSNEARRQMTADIAHDLRTPLTVITGYLESLRDGVLKPTPERFNILYNEATHLQRLVEDLRTLSLADAGELAITRQVIQPGELIRSTAAAFHHQAEQRGIHIQALPAGEMPPLQVDPERMGQVLSNLVSNALRYTPAGGEIRLEAQVVKHGVRLLVSDSGPGIAEDVLPHIFDRFYRGDDSRQGSESGLGLAIARAIVELHGGTIRAANAPTGGAVFTIQLPAFIPAHPA